MSSASTTGTPKLSIVSMNTSSAPDRTEGITIGKITVRKVRQRVPPRLSPASSPDKSTAFSAATTGISTKGKECSVLTNPSPPIPTVEPYGMQHTYREQGTRQTRTTSTTQE